MNYLSFFLLGALFTLLLTPRAIRLCYRWGLLDHPEDRKIHKASMPLAGGLVLFPLSLAGLLFMSLSMEQLIYLAVAMTAIFITGLVDDKRGIHFYTKFLFQTAAALFVIKAGFLFDLDKVFFLKNIGFHSGYILSIAITIIWIVGITNAVNLIDGVDGLAAGLSLIAFAGIGALSLASNSPGPAIHCIIMTGGILGFLRYNIFPARTFLGDSGSLVLGFILSVASIMRSTKTSTFLVLVVPVLFLAIPMLDTSLAFTRRAFQMKNPFRPDREHLHHRLLALNFSTTQVLGIFYGLSAFLGVLALALAQTVRIQIIAFALFTLAVALTTVRYLQVYNFAGFIRDINARIRNIARRAVGSKRHNGERLKSNMIILTAVIFLNLFVAPSLSDNWIISPFTALALGFYALGMVDLYLNKIEFAPRYEITRTAILLSLVLNQIALMTLWGGIYELDMGYVAGAAVLLILAICFLFVTGTMTVFLTDPVDILALYLGTLTVGLAKHYLRLPSIWPLMVVLSNALVLYALIRVYLAGYRFRSRVSALGFGGCFLFLLLFLWR